MTGRFTQINLADYPVADVLEALSFETYLARDRADLNARWEARRLVDASLPPLNAVFLESDPSSIILEVGSYRELLLRARVNDAVRQLTLAGASGAYLDHIGVTYYRTPRLVITEATGSDPAVMENDEVYRRRLSLAPESWSTAGPLGAYLFWALSASGDVRDVAVYSEDEGVCLAPRVRVVVLSRTGDGTADASLCSQVLATLSRLEIRPLADLVAVESAVPLPFDLEVNLTIKTGASAAMVSAAARSRLEAYCAGQQRWMGEEQDGPVWLIGRVFREETLAAVAMGGDGNIVDVDVVTSGINLPHTSYTDDALSDVGLSTFEPLSEAITAHLFKAPIIGKITVNTTTTSVGW